MSIYSFLLFGLNVLALQVFLPSPKSLWLISKDSLQAGSMSLLSGSGSCGSELSFKLLLTSFFISS
jgi:hypothetical protein